MDKPVERVRVLGVSPETNEVGIRSVLEVYGEILETRKGFISKKLPGCTNGIWTVKLIMDKDKCLPPFLIMKEEGEVWQLPLVGKQVFAGNVDSLATLETSATKMCLL